MQTPQATVRTWVPNKLGVTFEPQAMPGQNRNQNHTMLAHEEWIPYLLLKV